MFAAVSSSFEQIASVLVLTLPSFAALEILSAASFLALIISIMLSAFARSSFPFKKARLVNSPPAAAYAPLERTARKTALDT